MGGHGGTEYLLGRFDCLGDPLERSAQDLEDPFNTRALFLWESVNAISGMPRVQIAAVVVVWLVCVHPAHLERKKDPWCSRLGATFQGGIYITKKKGALR